VVITGSVDLGIVPEQVTERTDCQRITVQRPSISLRKLNDTLSALVKAHAPRPEGANHADLLQY
jgi:hypothetical protein